MESPKTDTLALAISASINAGKAIMEIYQSDFDVEYKEDNSPLTIADKNSHAVIDEALKKTGLPVMSEEGKAFPYSERKDWEYFWMVDPLDGTKEFIKKNGEFTVNIALMKGNYPIFGIIYVPVHEELYFGGKEFYAHKISNIDSTEKTLDDYVSMATLLPHSREGEKYIMIGSRSHMSEDTKSYFDKVKEEKGEVSIMSRGSSLKLCMIAEGRADEYPRFAPTMEWDVAAGQAIIEGAGGSVIHFKSGEIMRYNRENLVNSWFLAKKD